MRKCRDRELPIRQEIGIGVPSDNGVLALEELRQDVRIKQGCVHGD